MAVDFKFAVFEISDTPVLVDRKKIDETSKALKEGLEKVKPALTDAMLAGGFGVETPEGMNPVVLGNVNNFSNWVAEKLGVKSDDTAFNLDKEIKKLPPPFNEAISKITNIDIKLYSAALFLPKDSPKKLYGELVIGFDVQLKKEGFPLALNEIVISINNFT